MASQVRIIPALDRLVVLAAVSLLLLARVCGRDATVHADEVSSSGRLFSFGIISDIQYANIPDGFSFKGVPRYYR